ncbi:MAG: hypothetical protein ABSB74_20470 [Tepidisphaeraceae bacterium]
MLGQGFVGVHFARIQDVKRHKPVAERRRHLLYELGKLRRHDVAAAPDFVQLVDLVGVLAGRVPILIQWHAAEYALEVHEHGVQLGAFLVCLAAVHLHFTVSHFPNFHTSPSSWIKTFKLFRTQYTLSRDD